MPSIGSVGRRYVGWGFVPAGGEGWGDFLFQSQKRGVSNSPGRPFFCQRG